MDDIAIQVNNLSKVYKIYDKSIYRLKESINPFKKKYHKDFYALNNISFEVKKGETIGIIGKNGSGKSTLLKIITGVLNPSAGNVAVNGKVSALLELGAGFNPEFTGIENIYLNGTIMGYRKEEMDEKIQSILEFSDIGDFVYQPVKSYSSGMFVRLAFAVAVSVEPEVLIVDEALAVGDYRFQAKCHKKIDELRKKGKTILLVTHDIDSVRKFCDKVMWLNCGEMVEYGDVTELTSRYIEYMNSDTKDCQIDSDDDSFSKDFTNEITKFDPINRWGSINGIIKYVSMGTSTKKATNIFETGESVFVEIRADLTDIKDISNASIAFSVKDKSGLDLFVSTTYDYGIKISKSNYLKVKFEFVNCLVPGDYILVVAVEDRVNGVPEYYDYIEGAEYIKVLSKRNYHGLINVPTTIVTEDLGFRKD